VCLPLSVSLCCQNLKAWTDPGDIIGVTGTVKRTEKGEMSVVVKVRTGGGSRWLMTLEDHFACDDAPALARDLLTISVMWSSSLYRQADREGRDVRRRQGAYRRGVENEVIQLNVLIRGRGLEGDETTWVILYVTMRLPPLQVIITSYFNHDGYDVRR
jgi:hypothetical protein